MSDDRKNLKLNPETYGLLRAAKPGDWTWDEFLTWLVSENSGHDVSQWERNGPGYDYVGCDDCGRSNNHLVDLADRECKPGISVKE